MTPPCSAYCRPADGLHVVLAATTSTTGSDVGRVCNVRHGAGWCIPDHTVVLVEGEEPAVEADPVRAGCDTKHPHMNLLTLRVMA